MIVTFHKQKTLLAPKTVNHWIKLVFNKFSTFNWVLFGVISELSIGDLISRGEGKTNIRNIQMENWFKWKIQMLSLALSCASSRSEWLRQSENFLCKTNEGSTFHRKGDKMISEIPLLLVVTLVFGSISLIGSEGCNIYLEAKPCPATITLTSFRHQPGWKQFLF